MKICWFLTSISLVLSSFVLRAQQLPDLKIPTPKPSYYESLQSNTIIQTTSDLQMKGPVKIVVETISTDEADKGNRPSLVIEYAFSENGNLLKYSQDTNSRLFTAYDEKRMVINKYDSTGKKLLESITYRGYPGHGPKSRIRFNEQGFMEHEDYVCYGSGFDSHNGQKYDSIFDYTLDYHWSRNFDSVQLRYHYLKPQSLYQRNYDMLHSFVREINDKKKNTEKNKVGMVEGFGSYWNFADGYEYDSQGRIIKWTIWDYEVKSSVNAHQRYEYTYNEKGELSGIKHSSTGRSPDYHQFVLNFQVEINYTAYDEQGNWIEREVKVTTTDNGWRVARENANYCYKREFVYY